MFAQMIVVDSRLDRILLVRHKTGEMSGYYTGLLGEISENETPQEAAIRIAQDMCGISVQEAELRAVFEFTFDDSDAETEYEYYTTLYNGRPQETAHIKPEWFEIEKIPYLLMPGDDAVWYPPFLQGKLQRGKFHLARDYKTLLHYEVNEVDAFCELSH